MVAFIQFNFVDVIDIILMGILLYGLYQLLKGTAAIRIFLGIVAIYLAWKLVAALQMQLLSEVFGAFISVGFIALIVVFQPEIRTFLFRLGNQSFIRGRERRFLFWKLDNQNADDKNIDKVIAACQSLAKTKTGALIVITFQSDLHKYVESGEILNADISPNLIENIFVNNSPLHDGAIIIRNDKIIAASCILPVSKDSNISSKYGLRHRAGMGVTEQTDAISIIVSEETGNITLAEGGQLIENLDPEKIKSFIIR